MNMQFRPGDQSGAEARAETVVRQAIADCDIHPQRKDPKGLHPYLEKRWRDVELVVHMGAVSSTTEPDADKIIRSNFQLSRDLMVPVTVFSVDGEYGVVPSDEIDMDDDLEIVHEFFPWPAH